MNRTSRSGKETAPRVLAGTWRFRLDPDRVGRQQAWYDADLPEAIRLPGSTDTNRRGTRQRDDAELWGSWTREWTYVGAAWYQRLFEVPRAWDGKRVVLFLERCHWRTSVWVNGAVAGTDASLSTPHRYDLTTLLKPGLNRLAVEVDNANQVDIGPHGHSITDWTQTNWNGLTGRLELRVTDPLWVQDVRSQWIPESHTVAVTGFVHALLPGLTEAAVTAEIRPSAPGARPLRICRTTVSMAGGRSPFRIEVPAGAPNLPGLRTWDEWSPNCYRLRIRVEGRSRGRTVGSTAETPLALRDLRAYGRQLMVGERSISLRGTLECCIFPGSGYPPTQKAAWRRLYALLKRHGLNHVRFHTWCPPEAAFEAADEAGIYLQPELPLWGPLEPGSGTEAYLLEEGRRVIDAYGEHPSFCFLTLGNEIERDWPSLSRVLAELKRYDGQRRLYSTHANNRSAEPLESSDFFNTIHHRSTKLRIAGRFDTTGIHAGGGTSHDYSQAVDDCSCPIVAHEVGQWVVHPDYSEIPRYHGPVKPYGLVRYRERLRRNGLGRFPRVFQRASGRLSWGCFYKEDIECMLRTPGFGGFQLLQMNDFPGQGEAFVGAFDVHWRSKRLFSAREFRAFCSETVLLLRMASFVWKADQPFSARVCVYHFGKGPRPGARVAWTIRDARGGAPLASGDLPPVDLRQGTVTEAGQIDLDLRKLPPAPGAFVIGLSLRGTGLRNQWPIWIYPPEPAVQVGDDPVVVKTVPDGSVKALLEAGRSVLLTLPLTLDAKDYQHLLRTRFSPVFWSFRNIPTLHPGTLGLLCDPRHPVFARFPTANHSDWQWLELMNGAVALFVRHQPQALAPLVRCIDDFHRAEPAAFMLEARVGRGRLLISGCDLASDLPARFVAAQLRRSVMDYMSGPRFNPRQTLDFDALFERRWMRDARVLRSSAEEPGFEGFRVLDADWYSGWRTPVTGGPGYPHELQIDLGCRFRFAGIRYVPFQQKPLVGVIRSFDVFAADSPDARGNAVLSKRLSRSDRLVQDLYFDRPVQARFLTFVATSPFGTCTHAALGELELLGAVRLDPATTRTGSPPGKGQAAARGDDGDYNVEQV